MGSHMLYFPKEIIRNILKRLPVKSLIRFQCVCKDWKNLIKNQSFITDHLQHSSHQHPLLFLNFHDANWLLLLDGALQAHRIPVVDSVKHAIIVSSCNGLLCLETYQSIEGPTFLSLWNPATTEVKHLPKTRNNPRSFVHCVAGFGFSEVINDYKIVRSYFEFSDYSQVVQVFSLSRGTWKDIHVGNLKYVNISYQTVTLNGAIFWFGEKLCGKKRAEDYIEAGGDENYTDESDTPVHVIVSFDIANEVFTLIPRPHIDYLEHAKLTVYENKLALLCKIRENTDEPPSWIDLWVLDGGAWTKRYSSSPLYCGLYSMAMWGNKIVYSHIDYSEDREKGRHVLYLMNPSTNEVERFDISYSNDSYDVHNHVESLVSIGNN